MPSDQNKTTDPRPGCRHPNSCHRHGQCMYVGCEHNTSGLKLPAVEPKTTTHTPGPWVWRWKSGSLHQVGTDRPYGATVLAPTYSYDEGVGVEVSDADDRLIAAAPDLLAACRRTLAWCRLLGTADDDPVLIACQTAIAKAEGAETHG